MRPYYFLFICFLYSLQLISQDTIKSKIIPYKIGVIYNFAANENFIFNDVDYDYSTKTIKLQGFYKLGKLKSFQVDLVVQPQIQFINHQLLNIQYITPDQDNFLIKREEFSMPKRINLYALEFGVSFVKRLTNFINFRGTVGLGFSFINKRTERLAKGFTFLENFSMGFSHNIFKNSNLYFGANFGHVSNLNFKKPNDGYNILGIEFGYSIFLN